MPVPSSPAPAPEELRVSSPTELAAYLADLKREHVQVVLSSPGGHHLTSHVCAFDPAADVLAFEVGVDPQGAIQHLVASSEVMAVAYLGAIRLQFELDTLVVVSGEHGTVLRCHVPARLYRFQRRQAYRVQPAGQLFPRVLLPQPDGSHRALRVLDISVGGLALQRLADAAPIEAGQAFPDVTLELDRTTPLQVGLRAQHVSEWPTDGRLEWHVGCSFMDLATPVMRALQVYVDQTQKRRRLLKLDA